MGIVEEFIKAVRDLGIPLVLVVGGILFILLAFVGTIGGRFKIIISSPKRQWAVGIIGAIFLCLGLVTAVVPVPPSPISSSMMTPTPTLSPSVTITFPVEGSKVPGSVIVRGTGYDIPQNEELWLFILPEGATGYFPQPGPIKVLSDSTWSVTAYIGQQEGSASVGKKFVLIPALVDKNDREAQDAIQKYLSQPGPMYKGIEPLPSGIQLLSPISVIRT